ncbi:MAG: hypothetical protein R8M46_03435 [Ghiorsea sp.]
MMLLRPEFTDCLVDKLLTGENINLISPHGQGRRRTLKDLKLVLKGKIQIEQFDVLRDNSADLISIIKRLEQVNEQSLLILHNYDLFNDKTLKQTIRGMKKTVILTVSETLKSTLDTAVTQLVLPKLTHEELINEIESRGTFYLNASQTKEFAASLLLESAPYTCLEAYRQ